MTLKVDGTNGVLQAYDYQVLTTGFSYTFAAGTQVLVINPADALATGTVTTTSAPADGMTLTITTTKTIAALTVAANTGQSIVNGDALTLGSGQTVAYIYSLANTTWYPYTASLSMATASDVTGTTTTGTLTSGTAALTVASATGVNEGDWIVGQGIAPGTYVTAISGTSVTMSANGSVTLSSDPVTFYETNKSVTPASVGGMLCRAWVNFTGSGTVAARAAFNVTSIADNGVGSYTVNFDANMPTTSYARVVTVRGVTGTAGFGSVGPTETLSVGSLAFTVQGQNAGTTLAFDSAVIGVTIFH